MGFKALFGSNHTSHPFLAIEYRASWGLVQPLLACLPVLSLDLHKSHVTAL